MFTARLIIFGAQFGDALALISLVGLNAYDKWIKAQEFKPLEQETKKQLEQMQNTIAGIKLNNLRQARPDETKGRHF